MGKKDRARLSVTTERGVHTARSIVQMFASSGINAINGYRIMAVTVHRGDVFMGVLFDAHPSMVVISNDNLTCD